MTITSTPRSTPKQADRQSPAPADTLVAIRRIPTF